VSFGDTVHYYAPKARPFGDALHRVLKAKRFYEKSRFGALADAWAEAVGDEVAARTRIASYRHGILKVEVASSVLLHELSGFMKSAVLAALKECSGGRDVADIRFCLGAKAGQ